MHNKVYGLDLLRAIAVIWVILIHAHLAIPDFPSVPGILYGWMGVDLFFVLSGYLIGTQLLKLYANDNISLGRFYLNRLLRILPAYLTVLALYFIFPGFKEKPGIQPLWQFLTFTENLYADFYNGRAFSSVWSLCIEEQFYLVLPIILLIFNGKHSIRSTITLSVITVISGMILRNYIFWHDLKPILAVDEGPNSIWVQYQNKIYYPTYTRLDDILAGLILASISVFRPDWWQKYMCYTNLILLMGILGLIICFWLFADRYSPITIVFGYPLVALSFSLVVLAAISPDSILVYLKIPLVTAISTLSYSLYLIHKPMFHLTTIYFERHLDVNNILSFIVYTAVVLVSAISLYYCVERPFLLLRNRINLRFLEQSSKPIYAIAMG